jgi:hypothetical protein
MVRRFASFSLLSILLLSTGTCMAYGSIYQSQTQFFQDATDLINGNQILKSWQNSSTQVGIGTIQGVACKLENVDKNYQTIFTYAEILVEIPLTNNLAQGQMIMTKYIGGQIGDEGLQVVMNWPSFANDTVTPPNVFELKAGMSVMFFVRANTETLTGYIPYYSIKDENANSMKLTQDSQPTSKVAESAGYGFGWAYGFYYHWEDLPIHYYIDPTGTDDIDGDDTEREFAAIQAACSAWESDPCSGIVFSYGGTQYRYDSWVDYACWPGGPGANGDGHSVIGWVSDYSHQNDTGNAIALAFRHYQAEEGGLWHLSETDIMIVDNGTNWVIGPTWGYNDFDVQSVVTHELGHLLGFDDLYTPGNNQQTMYHEQGRYGNIDHQTLEWGDLNGVHYLYPEHDDAGSGGDVGGSPYGGSLYVDRNVWYTGRLCYLPNDEDGSDYYTFYAPSTMNIRVWLYPSWSSDFDLELYFPDGNLAAYSRTEELGWSEEVHIYPVGVSGFWTVRVYNHTTNKQFSNGPYEFYIEDFGAKYVSEITYAGWLSGYGDASNGDGEKGPSPDNDCANINGYQYGDSACIMAYTGQVASGGHHISMLAWSECGYNGVISVYVSQNNNYDWVWVNNVVPDEAWTIYDLGYTPQQFQYVGIAFSVYAEAAIHIDCVNITP